MPDDVIRYQLEPLQASHIDAFRKATRTTHFQGMPPTFVTYFRWAEFQWLERLKVNMRHLLHTGQEYEYRGTFQPGDRPEIVTRIVEIRERRGMKFVNAESEVRVNGEIRVVSHTSFVVSTPQESA